MEAFGSFEAIDVAREGNFGAVMYARRAGTSEKRFAVKVFRPPELLMDDDQIDREAAAFVEAAQNQQRAHGAFQAGWAPVHEFGLCQGGAWYATDLMECSLEILRITQRDLEPDHIRKIIEPVVQGLVALRQTQGRAHGNIKPTNVLIQGRADLSRARIVLSDPKPTSRCRSPEDDQRDARDLGDLVHQLVLHKPFQNLTEWPIQSTDRWQRLGRVGAAWLELVNRLIDPTTTSKPSIDEIAASLPGGPVKLSPAARDAERAEAERKAREEQAREEESRRKAREAEIAQRVRAEAEKKAKEEAERKAEAQRKAEEADRAAREAEARRAEEDRRRSEQQAREAAAAAEKARHEREEVERKSQEEKARQQKEQAERAKKEQEQARLLERERAEQEARRKADTEKAEKIEEAQRAAREKARQAEAEARARKQAEESAGTSPAVEPPARPVESPRPAPTPTQPAAPAARPVDSLPAPAPVKSGGGSKKAILAAAAMVVVGGGLAAVYFLGGGSEKDPVPGDGGGGGQNQVVVADPPRPVDPDPTTATAVGSETTDTGGTPPTPAPTVPTTAQVEESVRRNIGIFEQRLLADLSQAAAERAGEHERSAVDRVRQSAAGAALTRAREADVTSSEGDVSAAARASAVQAARAAFADGFSPATPPWTDRPEVGRVRSDLITRVKDELPEAPDDVTMAAITATIQGLIDREWKRLTDEALQSQADRVSAAAADDAMGPARQAFAARVEEARRIAASSTPATEPTPEVEPTPAAPTQQELAALRDAASAIGRDLDSGSGADDGGAQARAAMAALERSPWFDRVAQDGAVTRIRARLDALERIASADAARAIPEARGAISSVGGASEALAAWTRLSSVGGAADLNEIAALREATVDWAANLPDPAVGQRIERAANQAARDLWNARAAVAQDDAAIDAARALRERMAVGDGDVLPGVAFNFALREFKQAVAGATGPTNQRVEALKAPARAFVDAVGTLGPVASQQVVEASVAAAREILDWRDPGPAPAGGGGDLTRAGPGSVGWVAAPAADGMSVTYTWPAEGATRPEQRLTFRRIDTPGGRSAYLSETEIPVSLFRRLFGPDFAANDREFTSPTSGLKAWSIDRGTVVLAAEIIEHPTITLRNNRPLTLQNIQRWSGLANLDSISPAWTWPLQYISPRAAVVVAGKIGCRLPSADEWRAASRRSAGQEPNLRDASWFGVLDAARNYDFKGNPVYPDHGSIRRQGLNADGREARNDGYPFFSPVDTGPDGTWKNLIGNVAEWVFADPITGSDPIADSFDKVDRGWRYAVVGGSAVGPASIAGAEAEPILDHRNGSFFDVGFRVAFSATSGGAPGPVFDETKISAITGAAYLPPGR